MTYIFEEYSPQPVLLIIGLVLYAISIFRSHDILQAALIGLTLISLWLSISFSRKNFFSRKLLEDSTKGKQTKVSHNVENTK